MHWSFPAAFLLLPLLLLPWLLRRKQIPQSPLVVGSIALWKQLAARRGQKLPHAKFRISAHQILWVCGLFCLIAAASAPGIFHFATIQEERAPQVLVLDNRLIGIPSGDAGMPDKNSAVNQQWESLAGQARQILTQQVASHPVAIIQTAPVPKVVHPPSQNIASLLAVLESVRPQPCAEGDQFERAAALAAQVVQAVVSGSQADGRAAHLLPATGYWVSPRAVPATFQSGTWTNFFPVLPNQRGELSLSAVALARHPEAPELLTWQTGWMNRSDAPRRVLLQAGRNAQLVSHSLQLPPNSMSWHSGSLQLQKADDKNPAEVVLRPAANDLARSGFGPDFFSKTSEHGLRLGIPQKPEYEVEIVAASRSAFWELVFAAMPGWRITRTTPENWKPRAGTNLRVFVEIGDEMMIRESLKTAPAWLVRCGPFFPGTADTAKENAASGIAAAGMLQEREHPAVAGLDLEGIRVADRSISATNPEFFAGQRVRTLLQTGGTQLLLAGEAAQNDGSLKSLTRRWLALGFSPDESSLPLRAEFPAFVRQGTLWLLNRKSFVNSTVFVAGGLDAASPSPTDQSAPRIGALGFSPVPWLIAGAALFFFSARIRRKHELPRGIRASV